MGSKVVRADFGSGLICPRAQTCMDSKVVRADFGSGLICPGLKHAAPRLRRLRLGLQTRRGSNHSTAHVGKSNSRSNVFQIRHAFVCVSSRWKVLSGEFRRRPTALAIKFHKSDRVGRRGLSEPREDFSRLPNYAFPCLDSVAVSVTCAMRAISSATLQAKHHRSSRTTAA